MVLLLKIPFVHEEGANSRGMLNSVGVNRYVTKE